LDIVHDPKKDRVQMAEQGSRERAQDSRMHHARSWAKEQPARGNKVLNRHSTPEMRDSRDLREKRDWPEVLSSRVAPVAQVSLTPRTRG
jgi:hypothetical protein